jgi:hypothetical protein
VLGHGPVSHMGRVKRAPQHTDALWLRACGGSQTQSRRTKKSV